MRTKEDDYNLWLTIGGLLLMGVLIFLAIVDSRRQQALIDTGFCSLVFTEDDGDENYICEDGTRFEREYD